jgi:hypothetical protein
LQREHVNREKSATNTTCQIIKIKVDGKAAGGDKEDSDASELSQTSDIEPIDDEDEDMNVDGVGSDEEEKLPE